MRYTTTDGPSKALNAIQDGSLGDKMGNAVNDPAIRKPKITLSGTVVYITTIWVSAIASVALVIAR